VTDPSCLAVNFLLASSPKAGWVSSCILAETLTFTLLYKVKIAAAVDFSVSDDRSRAESVWAAVFPPEDACQL